MYEYQFACRPINRNVILSALKLADQDVKAAIVHSGEKFDQIQIQTDIVPEQLDNFPMVLATHDKTFPAHLGEVSNDGDIL
jgi:hypothetical protein